MDPLILAKATPAGLWCVLISTMWHTSGGLSAGVKTVEWLDTPVFTLKWPITLNGLAAMLEDNSFPDIMSKDSSSTYVTHTYITQ